MLYDRLPSFASVSALNRTTLLCIDTSGVLKLLADGDESLFLTECDLVVERCCGDDDDDADDDDADDDDDDADDDNNNDDDDIIVIDVVLGN